MSYQRLTNDNIVAVDVDETLINWHGQTYTPNKPNIDALVREAKRGKFVIVWSRAGSEAANRAVDALGLGQYVNLIMAKPGRYIDDAPWHKWSDHAYYKEGDTTDLHKSDVEPDKAGWTPNSTKPVREIP